MIKDPAAAHDFIAHMNCVNIAESIRGRHRLASSKTRLLGVVSILFVLLLLSSSTSIVSSKTILPPYPPTPPMASVVIGQMGFNSSSVVGSGQAQLSSPGFVAVDDSGNLWVSDYRNGRVTEYLSPFSNGEGAALEIGAASFSAGSCTTANPLCEPEGIAFDPSGNLWVADSQNASVQEFRVPFSTGEDSSVLLGGEYLNRGPRQTDMDPVGLAFSSGNLWVADSGFNRILEFTPPFTNHEAAALVIGQAGFTTNWNNSNQSKLSNPEGLTFDRSGNLWVADTLDNRVLEFKAPFSNGEGASVAIGQPNLSSTSGNTTQSTLNQPSSVVFDAHGDLWVSDSGNNRIAEFTPPFTTGMNATVLIGQVSYFFSNIGSDQSSLFGPKGIAAGRAGNLWVTDTENARVLLFVDPSSAVTTTTTTTPRTTSTTSTTSASSSPDYTLYSVAGVVSVVIIVAAVAFVRRRRH